MLAFIYYVFVLVVMLQAWRVVRREVDDQVGARREALVDGIQVGRPEAATWRWDAASLRRHRHASTPAHDPKQKKRCLQARCNDGGHNDTAHEMADTMAQHTRVAKVQAYVMMATATTTHLVTLPPTRYGDDKRDDDTRDASQLAGGKATCCRRRPRRHAAAAVETAAAAAPPNTHTPKHHSTL